MKKGIVSTPQAFLFESREAALKKKKGFDGGITDELFYGWDVSVLEEEKDILLVRTFYGYEGYIRKSKISKTEKPEQKKQKGSSAASREGFEAVIVAPYADVLQVPRVQGKILISLLRGSLITIGSDQKENGYLTVLLQDGKKGYLPAVFLRTIQEIEGEQLWKIESQQLLEIQEKQLRENIVGVAETYLGTQYRWGGKSPLGIDCSGLAFMSYFLNGIIIYRDAEIREDYPIREISADQLKKGDLLYFPGHVAIYIGEDRFIHSTGHSESFGCVYGSFRKGDPGYREDLKNALLKCGSYFK